MTTTHPSEDRVEIPALSPVEAITLATESWDENDFMDSTIARMTEVAQRFARRVSTRRSMADIDSSDCDDFIHAATRHGEPPSTATLHFRRTTLRALYRSLRHMGVVDGDPTLDVILPAKSALSSRPLTDDEINLVRICALGRTSNRRGLLALALAETGATTREIPLVTVDHIDLDAGVVELPGGARVDPRKVELTRWASGVLMEHLDGATPGTAVVPTRSNTNRLPAQAGTCNLIATLLATAGLRAEPDVRPGSIRAWAGATTYRHTGRIEATARHLGLRSLDATADLIALDWHKQK